MPSGRKYVRLDDQEESSSDIQLSTLPHPVHNRPTSRGYFSLFSNRESLPSFPKVSYSRGWRFGVLSCAAGACLVFVINLVATIWTLAKHGVGAQGRQILFEGNCETTRKLNLGVHLLINVLSTILLSSSNYCMQCLSAATRRDIDAAHNLGKWLDIGVPSFRNLRHISRRRSILWWLLGLSSLPLHLFYNSAVFSSLTYYDYNVYTVDQTFETLSNHSSNADVDILWADFRGSLDRLDANQCISAYAQDINTARGDVIIVLDSKNASDVYEGTAHVFNDYFSPMQCNVDPYAWMCAQDGLNSCACEVDMDCTNPPTRCQNRLQNIRNNQSGWTPGDSGFKADHCWSQELPQMCTLQFSLHLGVVVLVLNLAKAAFMCMTTFGATEPPLLTIGDAISSFLTNPDGRTERMSLASKSDVLMESDLQNLQRPRPFHSTRKRWFRAASRARWAICISMYFLAMAICTFFLIFGIHEIKRKVSSTDASFNALLKLGIGAITPITFISWSLPSDGPAGLILNVLAANAAQPILSFLYFSYNGLFTSLFVAYEWESFSNKRKGLRVSGAPVGSQRSTYFLQLPYRIALPLMVISGLLHWLVSQSIFLVDIQSTYGGMQNSYLYDGDNLTCGYSPIAIFCVIMVGIAMIILVLVIGMQRYKSGMPVAGSCSVAISAACHSSQDSKDLNDHATQRVRWGVIDPKKNGVQRCGFSSAEVYPPVDGALYS